jgi:hypothetical protein
MNQIVSFPSRTIPKKKTSSRTGSGSVIFLTAGASLVTHRAGGLAGRLAGCPALPAAPVADGALQRAAIDGFDVFAQLVLPLIS